MQPHLLQRRRLFLLQLFLLQLFLRLKPPLRYRPSQLPPNSRLSPRFVGESFSTLQAAGF